MSSLSESDIVVAYISYQDVVGGKVRPAYIFKMNDEVIKVLRITSQYKNKSEKIQSRYFEIVDYVMAGLRKQSWIDTVQLYPLSRATTKIHVIGKLSNRDQLRLRQFLENLTLN